MRDLVEHGQRGDDSAFVLVEYAAPETCEVDDERSWAQANPALGDFLFEHTPSPPPSSQAAAGLPRARNRPPAARMAGPAKRM